MTIKTGLFRGGEGGGGGGLIEIWEGKGGSIELFWYRLVKYNKHIRTSYPSHEF